MRVHTTRPATRRFRRALRSAVVAAAALATLLVGASSASAGQPTAVTFVPDTNLSDTPTAVWTIGFTTSASGALISGNAVMVTFPSGFDVTGASAALVSGFGPTCTAPTTTVSAQNIFVQLNGASCGIGNSSPGVLTITGISSPATQYGTGALGGFKVASYGDATLGSPIDGVGGYPPPGGMFITASLTYSTQASDGTPTTGTAPVDPGSPFTIAADTTTIVGNTGGLTLPGYTFAGWCTTNTAPDPTQCTGGGTQYASGDPYTVSANTTLYSVWTLSSAADGSGTLTTPTTSVLASSTTTIVLTYTAAPGGMSNGAVHVQVPAGWSAPGGSAGAGCTTASVGTLAFAGQTIQLTGLSLAGGAPVTITYGATAGGGCTAGSEAVTPAAAGSGTFTATQKSTAGGTLTALASSPSVSVTVPSCTPGSYLAGVTCVPATPGSFVGSSGATSQTPCPAGSFSASTGATSCTPAPPGRYVATAGQTASLFCPPGTYSPSEGAASCTSASPGSIVSVSGATAQTRCAAGYFASGYGATKCQPAPSGSYVDKEGAAAATPCAVDAVSNIFGATACTPCPTAMGTRSKTGASTCRYPALRAGELVFSWGGTAATKASQTSVLIGRVGSWSDDNPGLRRFSIAQQSVPVPTNGDCSAASWSGAVTAPVDAGSEFLRTLPAAIQNPASPSCIRFQLSMYSVYSEDEILVVESNAQSTATLPAAVRVVVQLSQMFTSTMSNNKNFLAELTRDIAGTLRVSGARLRIVTPTDAVLMRASATPPANMFRLRSTRTRSGGLLVRLDLTTAGRVYLNRHPKLKGTRQRVSGTFFVRLKGSPTPVRLQHSFWLRMPR